MGLFTRISQRILGKPVREWVDERMGTEALLKKELTGKYVPKHRGRLDYFSCFGGLALVFFIIQVVTGGILLANYVPHPEQAFASVQHISETVPYGWFIRRVHAIGANFMVIIVFIHMMKVFLTGAYKTPRELHWISGVLLFSFVLAMCLSGYLLPWSQLSYWASTVATDAPGQLPGVGEMLKVMIRGGTTVTGVTLGRFFFGHVFLLPATMGAFMVAHFMMIRKTGIAEPL